MTATKAKAKASETPEAQLRAFINRYEPTQQKLIRSVRTALRKLFPTANELAYDYSSFFLIAYSATEHGIEAPLSLAARADRVELYFNHGPKLADPKKLLQGSGRQTRFIPLETARRLAHPDVKAFIAAALKLSKPLPARGEGRLIIKTNKSTASKAAKKPAKKK